MPKCNGGELFEFLANETEAETGRDLPSLPQLVYSTYIAADGDSYMFLLFFLECIRILMRIIAIDINYHRIDISFIWDTSGSSGYSMIINHHTVNSQNCKPSSPHAALHCERPGTRSRARQPRTTKRMWTGETVRNMIMHDLISWWVLHIYVSL